MSRQSGQLLRELVSLLAILPWYGCIILGLLWYFSFHDWLPQWFGLEPTTVSDASMAGKALAERFSRYFHFIGNAGAIAAAIFAFFRLMFGHSPSRGGLVGLVSKLLGRSID